MTKFLRLILPALLLALILVFSLAACRDTDDFVPPDDPELPAEAGTIFANPLLIPTGPGEQPTVLAEFSARARDLHAINDHTIGWLYAPNTSIDDVVMWYYPASREDIWFYLRRDFYRRWSWEGTYFADFRTNWGGGTRGEISRNIVIYGHSMEDDPNGALFSQFKRWKDEQWARENPYIFFSTLQEDMVWEIFSVQITNRNVDYIYPNPDDEKFQLIIDDAKARSIFNYDIEVTIEDTILTLSTCVYNIPTPDGFLPVAYPNDFRYVVVARLVEPNAILSDTTSLTVNPSPVDPRQEGFASAS